MPSFGEQLLSQALQSGRARRLREETAFRKIEKDKVSLLADPNKLDKLVASFTTMVSPSRDKLGTDYASKVDAADANIPSDHPLKGYGHSLRDNLRAQLASSENRGRSIEELVLNLSGRELLKEGESGKTLYEEAHEYKYKKDYRVGNYFGLLGEDENVRALPGYEEFKEGKEAITPEEINTTYKEALGFGAGLSAAGQVSRRAAIKWGGKRLLSWGGKRLVTGAALGPHIALASLAAVPAFKIFDATANVIERSHFGKSQGAVAKLGTEMIIGGLVPAWAGHKLLRSTITAAAKSGLIRGVAEDMLMRLPTAKSAIELGKHRAKEAKLAAKAATVVEKEGNKAVTKRQVFKAADDDYKRKKFDYEGLTRAEKREVERDLSRPFANEFTGVKTARPKSLSKTFAGFTDEQSDAALARAKTVGIREATKQVKEGADVLEGQRLQEIRDGIDKGLKGVDEYLTPGAKYTIDDLIAPFTSGKKSRLLKTIEKKAKKASKEIDDAVDKEVLAAKIVELEGDAAAARTRIAEMGKRFKGGLTQTKSGAVVRKKGKKGIEQVPDEVVKKKEAEVAKANASVGIKTIPVKGPVSRVPSEDEVLALRDAGFRESEIAARGEYGLYESQVQEAMKGKVFSGSSLVDVNNDMIEGAKSSLVAAEKKRSRILNKISKMEDKDIDGIFVQRSDILGSDARPRGRKELTESLNWRVQNEQNRLDRYTRQQERSKLVSGKAIPEGATEVSYQEAKRRLLASMMAKKQGPVETKLLDDAIENAETSIGKQVGKQQNRKLLKGETDDAEWLARAGESETIEDIFATTDGLIKEEFDPAKWKFFVLGGAAIPLLSLFSPGEAEASMSGEALKVAAGSKIPKVVMGFLKMAGKTDKQIRKSLIDSDLLYIPAAEGQKFFGERQQAISISKMVAERGEKLADQVIRSKSLPFGLDRLMSTAGFSRLFTKAGGEPAIELGSRFFVEKGMTDKGLTVLDNIVIKVKDYNVNPKEIIEIMQPLAERFAPQVGAYNAIEYSIKSVKGERNKILKLLKGKSLKGDEKVTALAGLKEAKKSLGQLDDALEELSPTVRQFNKDYEATTQMLAKNHPSVRMSLAAEDTVDFKHRPWLKDMMTFEEMEAVGYHKKLMDDYAGAVVGAYGKDAIIESRPFVHHAFHPSWKTKHINDELKRLKLGISPHPPYTQFHSRSRYSRQMVPHIGYNTGRYIPDAEKRIQMGEFWGRGKKGSWYELWKSPMVQGSDALRDFFQRIHNASVPASDHWSNRAANWYSSIEVFRLLGFSFSVAFKHLFKLPATYAQLGFGASLKHFPEAIRVFARTFAQGKGGKDLVKQLNLSGKKGEKAATDLINNTFVRQYGYMNTIMDMDMSVNVNSTFESGLKYLNEKGGVLVRGVEHFDRAHGILAATSQAAKKGMTAQQAAYGIVDTILKNNFLSGTLNPSWMRSPKVRALFLFQNTAFKIAERRLVGGIKALELSKAAGKSVKEKGLRQTLKELRGVKQFIKEGEHEFKESIILDALNADRGYFGTPQSVQFMKEILIMGSIIGAGGLVGVDLWEHANHIPFLKGHTKYPVLATSPIINAIFDTKGNRAAAAKASKAPEFLMTDFLKEWLWQGKYGPYPQTVKKGMRLSNDDIPKRYKGSPWKYLFSIPATE